MSNTHEASSSRETESHGPAGELAARSAFGRRGMPVLLLAIAAVVFAIDQLSKNWVVANLPEGETVPVLGGFLQWHFVRNPGAAFSMASGSTWIFTILATVVAVVIVWQIRRLRSIPWAVFLGLLLGGVLGNLCDRLTREPGFPEGHVIDFILTPWMWLGFNPAIYNVADIGIVSGMVLFVVISLLGLPVDGSPRAARGRGAEDAAAAEDTADTVEADEAVNADEAVDAAGGANQATAGADPGTDPAPDQAATETDTKGSDGTA